MAQTAVADCSVKAASPPLSQNRAKSTVLPTEAPETAGPDGGATTSASYFARNHLETSVEGTSRGSQTA